MSHAEKRRRRNEYRRRLRARSYPPLWTAAQCQEAYELAIRLTATEHIDRLVTLANMPPIDWREAGTSMLASDVGLRLVQP